MIKLLGYKINNIKFSIFGGIINTNININIRSIHLFLISISGIIFQLILFFVFPKDINYYNYNIFINLNTSLVIYNLLPIFPLDGYKILQSIFENMMSYRKIIIISYVISLIGIVFLYLYIQNLMILFLLITYNIKNILNFRYYYNKFLLERYLYDTYKKGIISVKNEKEIYKSKLNYIKTINEQDYLKNIFS